MYWMFMAVVSVSVAYVISYALKLRHERAMLDRQPSREDLEGALEELREQTQAQIAELHERLDFSERLLAERATRRPEESETPTPV